MLISQLPAYPLTTAIYIGDMPLAKMLISQLPVDVLSSAGIYGWTPLKTAARCNTPDIVKLLLQRGISPNQSSKQFHGHTPLRVAAWMGLPEVMQALLEAGGNANECDANGWTLLHSACINHVERITKPSLETIRLLLNHGANPNAQLPNGQKPIDCCQTTPHKTKIAAILKQE